MMEGFFVEVKENGRIVFALDVPVLDCVRVPSPLGGPPPVPIRWQHDGPGRYRAEHTARLSLGPDARHYELTARVHS